MSRAIVNVAFGNRRALDYLGMQARLRRSLVRVDYRDAIEFYSDEPVNAPPHAQVPYAFKQTAMSEAAARNRVLLWLDAVIVALLPLDDVFRRIEERGYLLWSHPPGQWTVGEWTSDACLAHYKVSRGDARDMPSVCSAVFGYSLEHPIGAQLHEQFVAAPPVAMRGDKHNRNGIVSNDRRVQGHRHDQSVLGILAHKLALELSPTPDPVAPHGQEGERTVFACDPDGKMGW